ncbi:hypothetical protein ACYOEI_05085 [Singulisphaera rosea]
MAKRRNFSRWRRLPEVFRTGEHKMPDPGDQPQRISLYVVGNLLDVAEVQARNSEFSTLQEYCADLLSKAIEAQRIREQVADVEAKRGALGGLHEIANDPAYLAEWSAQAIPSHRDWAIISPEESETGSEESATPSGPRPIVIGRREDEGEYEDEVEVEVEDEDVHDEVKTSRVEQGPGLTISLGITAAPEPRRPESVATPPGLSPAARSILRHAGKGEDPNTFLPCLRRGASLEIAEVAELAKALQDLEREYRSERILDRQVVFALHRLAYEGQVLLTDAWPNHFDEWTVDTLRAVQEAVERILSGRDIRYFSDAPRPEDLH